MQIRHVLAALATAAVIPGAITLAAAPASAGATYQYNFQEHKGSSSFVDSGLCNPGSATIELIDYNEALHVTANQAGLSQDQVEVLLENGSDTISKLTYTQEGSFRVTETGGSVYTGHFASWFGGSVNRTTTVFSGTFNVNGVSADGRRISGHFVSHVTFKNGEPVIAFDKGDITDCPPAT